MSEIFDYPELIESGEPLTPMSRACVELFNPPISKPTGVRYYIDGVRGVLLKTVRIGGVRCTTAAEVKRFSLAQLENPAPPDNESVSKPTKRSTKKISTGMTAEEITAGLARHKLE